MRSSAQARPPRALAAVHAGALEQLTSTVEDETAPAVSPDGARLIFTTADGARLMPLRPWGVRGAHHDEATNLPVSPIFFGDAASLIYRDRVGGSDALLRVDAKTDVNDALVIPLPDAVASLPSLRIDGASCSSDARRFAATVATERSELERTDMRSVGGFQLGRIGTRRPLPMNAVSYFGSHRSSQRRVELGGVTIRMTRTAPRVVTFTESGEARWLGNGAAPAVSPDGSAVAFVATEGKDRHAVVAAVGGSEDAVAVRPFVDGFPVSNPAFSPDGKWIAIVLRGGEPGAPLGNLVVARTDGGESRVIATSGSIVRDLTWARDGRVYFAANPTGNFDLYRIDPRL